MILPLMLIMFLAGYSAGHVDKKQPERAEIKGNLK
jgi:hypothetical protein